MQLRQQYCAIKTLKWSYKTRWERCQLRATARRMAIIVTLVQKERNRVDSKTTGILRLASNLFNYFDPFVFISAHKNKICTHIVSQQTPFISPYRRWLWKESNAILKTWWKIENRLLWLIKFSFKPLNFINYCFAVNIQYLIQELVKHVLYFFNIAQNVCSTRIQ